MLPADIHPGQVTTVAQSSELGWMDPINLKLQNFEKMDKIVVAKNSNVYAHIVTS